MVNHAVTPDSHELHTFNENLTRSTDLRTHHVSDAAVEADAEQVERAGEVEMRSLPPTDHGKSAYLVLLGCTLIQAPVWGYSLAFGIFQEYYTTHPNLIRGPSSSVATVGTTLNGLMYLSMPLTFTLLSRYPHIRRYCGPIGLIITVSSLVLSSFAKQIWQLILTQGILCAVGSGLLFAPTTLYLDEWFIARKGMAYGVLWAGKSVAGVIFPFLMSALLSRYGAKSTLQIWAVSLAIIASPLLFFLKPRIPLSATTTARPLSWTFLKSSTFWMLQAGNVIQSFGYLLPTTYLASYAHGLGLPNITGAALLAVYSFASAPGGVVMGILTDKLQPTTVILISSLGSAAAVFLFWGLARHLALLTVFAIVYGFFAGGFSSTYPGILNELKREDEGVDTGLVMGLLLGGRGIGFVVGGPLSGVLLGLGRTAVGWGYNGQYREVIVVTGITAALGGWAWMWNMGKKLMN